jgi:Di-haem oxidoreductase, putative peroxidase
MLADEITTDLRAIRTQAINRARSSGRSTTLTLTSKGINYGSITASQNGQVNTSGVRGVNPDLRVRPLFVHGETTSIREFLVGAFNAEMGLEAHDPDLLSARAGNRVVTPSGMVLNGQTDFIEAPPVSSETEDFDQDGVSNEIPTSIVDFMEFYLLHYFKAAVGEGNPDIQPVPWGEAIDGKNRFTALGCATCHIPNLTINRDRRVADVETRFDPAQGNPLNRLFATASLQLTAVDDGSGFPALKRPNLGQFVVRNIFTDFKRHDLGPNFFERNYDGTIRREFLTTALWGVGDTAPYGHDGRSMNLMDVILRHGGEAQQSRDAFANAGLGTQRNVVTFLRTLVLFPPDDTASNLDRRNVNAVCPPQFTCPPNVSAYPQFGHGSIRLGALFNDPTDPE